LFELDADVFKIDVSAAQSELDEARAKQTAIEAQIARAVVARKGLPARSWRSHTRAS